MVAREIGLRVFVALVLAGGMPSGARASEATDLARCETGTAERIRFIEERLEQRRPYAMWWWRGWTSAYGVGTVLQGVRAGVEDSEGRQADLAVSAGKALIGTVRLLIDRPTARLGAEPMHAVLPTHEAACRQRLSVGEDLLRQNAIESRAPWDLKRHLGNVLVNVAGAVIVAYGFDDETRGWRSAGIGIAVGEAMILSYPRQGDDDLAEYEQRFNGASAPRTSLHVLPAPGGARLVLAF